MKNTIVKGLIITLGLIALLLSNVNAQIGIGTNTPDASAALDITSTNKGVLLPRMTGTQRDLISTPVQGLMIFCTNCGNNGELQVYNGSAWTNSVGGAASITIATVVGANGKIWMDRNLGATRVATFSTDDASYGDLYQWGRGTDGHQIRTSGTAAGPIATPWTSTSFITNSTTPYDWRNPKEDNLWQGVSGTNNPCPSGYRLPTDAEWTTEMNSWSSKTSVGAFNSTLKLPLAGYRLNTGGLVSNNDGIYWSSSISSNNSKTLSFATAGAGVGSYTRATGNSVRCIKN
jgi:uncharacterized protein (TIGR02145 family)